MGLGFPSREHWTELDPLLLEGVLLLENHYQAYFSTSRVIINYMETIIKRMDAYLTGKK
jgi:hypothetical protein